MWAFGLELVEYLVKKKRKVNNIERRKKEKSIRHHKPMRKNVTRQCQI